MIYKLFPSYNYLNSSQAVYLPNWSPNLQSINDVGILGYQTLNMNNGVTDPSSLGGRYFGSLKKYKPINNKKNKKNKKKRSQRKKRSKILLKKNKFSNKSQSRELTPNGISAINTINFP